jgi:hypothetical protein
MYRDKELAKRTTSLEWGEGELGQNEIQEEDDDDDERVWERGV